MHIHDIFYSILQETHFFSSFFYQQFLIDISQQIVHDIKNKKQQSLSLFLNKHSLFPYLYKKQEVIYTSSCLILKPKEYSDYIIVLYWNKELLHLNDRSHFIPTPQYQILCDLDTIESLLYKNPTYPIYIAFFDFYSNQDMTNPHVLHYIYDILTNVLKKQHSYLYHYQYNKYYLIFKGMTEVEVLTSCISIYQEFNNTKEMYLVPHFLITEYKDSIDFEHLIHKMYYYFIQLPENDQILTKQSIANIIQ